MDLEEIANSINKQYKQMVYSHEPKRETLLEGKYMDYQFYILNLGLHPTAYIEIPITSKLYNKSYDEIYEMGIDIDVHGGLTYSNNYLTEIKYNTWFIGWDYAHFDDFSGLDLHPINIMRELTVGGKKWTTEEIFQDVTRAIEQIREVDENE